MVFLLPLLQVNANRRNNAKKRQANLGYIIKLTSRHVNQDFFRG